MNGFSKTLVDWYVEHGRDLPWRHTTDPYRVWVSEIILQQTRVAQGWAYYQRFVDRLPDVRALAEASEDEVLRLWQGLGYYSRARHLHRAARSLLPDCRMPRTYEGVRALPGVGDYTAAAICSLAYGMPLAVVDGNVYRVLSRYFGLATPIDTTEGRRLFARLAQELLDPSRPGLHNQAMMDLGATVCTPRQPRCSECPLADACLALAEGRVGELPVKAHRTRVTDRYLIYIMVWQRGPETAGQDCLLLRRREGDDIWRGLWEMPLVEADHALTPEELLRTERWQSFVAEGETPTVRPVVRGVRHVLTHRIFHVDLYELRLPAASRSFAGYVRVPREELSSYALPILLHDFLEKYL